MKNTVGFKISSLLGACLGSVMVCATMPGNHSLIAAEAAASSAAASSGNPVTTAPAQEETYNNWVDLTLGGLIVHGDQAQFSQEHHVTGDVFGGVQDMHIERTVGKAQLTLDGHAIFDQSDYNVKLELSMPNVGYIRAGYTQFRTWYDGNGGYYPANASFNGTRPPSATDEYAVDRGDAWIELGLRMPTLPEITLRYDHIFREGEKDSTIWGSSTFGAFGAASQPERKVVPSYRGIDEQRDIFTLDATKTIFGNTDLALGMSYEHDSINDSLNWQRYPGNSTLSTATTQSNRYVTQTEQMTSDLFSGHFSSETRFSDKLWFTLAYSYTTDSSDIGGSRIYGLAYDLPYIYKIVTNVIPGSTGFINLSGGSQMDQHVINLNFMYRPTQSLTITPSVRIENNDTTSDSFYNITSNSAAAPYVGGINPNISHAFSEYDYTNVSECLDVRYTGFENWVLYATGNWEEETGNRRDNEKFSLLSATGANPLNLNCDAVFLRQKYAVGANWYPLPRLNLALQYYYKVEDNHNNFLSDDYNAVDNQRLVKRSVNMNDVNFRVTVRPLPNLSLVTRYDFQYSTIDDQWRTNATVPPTLYSYVESSSNTNHMISQSATWSPLSWMYLQGNFSYVLNQTHTPNIAGLPSVLNDFQSNYWTAGCSLGIALDDKTKLQADYTYYRANDFVDNSSPLGLATTTSGGVPYGAGATEHTVSASISRQITKNVRLMLRYSYYRYTDQLSGGFDNYDAHMISSSIQCRF